MSKTKPREFWIDRLLECYAARPKGGPLGYQESLIHVVDFASYQAALDQCEKLKLALEFYGDEMNYSVDDYHGISGEMRKRCVLYKDCEERNDVYSYAGQRARKALAEFEKFKDGLK
jgi:hypothetical protein